jgi:hypothetical protein
MLRPKIGTGGHQEVRHLAMTTPGGSMQRCLARSPAYRVHVSAVLEQCCGDLPFSANGGFVKRCVADRRRRHPRSGWTPGVDKRRIRLE